MNLLRRKSVTQLQADALTDHRLKRALGATNLTTLGIGAIIGTGIFVLTGTVAAQNAGPAVILSFVLAGVASIFAALCYSEFASLVPMAGSAYTYGYATLGELFAWIIGWDLILEYALGAVTVSIGWSGYVVSFLRDIGIHIPLELSAARGTLITLADGALVTAIFNLPAVIIIGSLLICTAIYILVSCVATGVMSYRDLNVPDPIAVAADHAGLGWMSSLIKLGAIAGLSSVILVMLLGQSRIFWTMADDGLLPKFVSRVHPKFRTPWITTILTGIVVAFFAALSTVRAAGSLVSIGTLLAFVFLSIGVLVLRIREPHLPRTFKTPAVWVVAPLGALSALYLMIALPWRTWERLIIWFVIGMVIYFFYGVRRSKLAQAKTSGNTVGTSENVP